MQETYRFISLQSVSKYYSAFYFMSWAEKNQKKKNPPKKTKKKEENKTLSALNLL